MITDDKSLHNDYLFRKITETNQSEFYPSEIAVITLFHGCQLNQLLCAVSQRHEITKFVNIRLPSAGI